MSPACMAAIVSWHFVTASAISSDISSELTRDRAQAAFGAPFVVVERGIEPDTNRPGESGSYPVSEASRIFGSARVYPVICLVDRRFSSSREEAGL